MRKAVVLSSGGLDSTVCLALAVKEFGNENVFALNIFYGQRHKKEIEASKKIAEYYHVKRIELDLSACFKDCKSSLMESSNEEISTGTYHEQLSNGRLHTVVPFRNGLFLSAAVSLILGQNPDDELVIYLGNHAGDIENHEYADCSTEFTDAMTKAIYFGTDGKVTFVSPFEGKKKSEIVKCGLSINVPFNLTWSCYNGKEKPCGCCPTCLQRQEAFKENNVGDPLVSEFIV